MTNIIGNQQKYKEKYYKSHPWAKTILGINWRCHNNKSPYFKKGIRNYLCTSDLKELWFRDKAYDMLKPSIDRIDRHGDYTFSNCRYLEDSVNKGKYYRERNHCSRGHVYTEKSLYIDPKGSRRCRICRVECNNKKIS